MSPLHDDSSVRVLVAGASPDNYCEQAPLRMDVAEGFAEVLGQESVTTCRFESAARQTRRSQPELVLLCGSCLPDQCDYAGLRRACDEVNARLAIWLHNDPAEIDAQPKFVSLADFLFSNDRWATTHYSRSGVWHLPLAASARRFASLPQQTWEERTCDILFAGDADASRQQLLADLAPLVANRRIEIHGEAWNLTSLINCQQQPLSLATLPSSLSAARLVLGASADHAAANHRFQLPPSSPSRQVFEAALAGRCQLLFADSLEILDYFELGSEILLFDDPADLACQLGRLLIDGLEACEIGAAAQQRALRDHTYAARARRVLECVGMESALQFPAACNSAASRLSA